MAGSPSLFFSGEGNGFVGDRAETVRIGFSAMSMESALGAARSWHTYRRRGGGRDRIAADFLIGGQAAAQAERLLTRDFGSYRKYFKGVAVVSP
jgi:predicted nucleic acid-binding protein